jgi:hypothetical protein
MLRLVGLVFLALGGVVLVADVLRAGGEGFRLTALGEWWFWLHPDSLQVLQPAIERHISPALWDPGVQTLLEWPLAVELFALGTICLAAAAIRR